MQPDSSQKPRADRDLEQLVGRLLRYGVLTACFVTGIGGVLYLLRTGGAAAPSYHRFSGEGTAFTTYRGILAGALQGHPAGLIQLGVLLLIATPILRVVCSLVGFVLEKDRLYTAITLVVLGVLLTSLFGGLKL